MQLNPCPLPLSINSNGCNITNSSGSPIIVLNSIDASGNTTKTVYENQLTQLLFEDGTKVLLDKETKTVNLKGNTFELSGKKIPVEIYNLVFADPDTSSPIDNCVVKKNNGSYPSLSITEKDASQRTLAQKFCKNILANPTSNLALNYTKTCKAILNGQASSKKEIASLGSKYFQSTKSYKTLTFPLVILEMSYLNNFVSPWVENGKYYLYSPASDTKGVTQSKAPTFIGTLSFARDSSSIDPADPYGGYAITLQEASGKITPVHYKQGRFYAEGAVVVSLKPTYTIKGRLTNKPQDKAIIPSLNGKVNKLGVFGIQTKQDLSSSVASESSWESLWHPENLKQWIELIAGFSGVPLGSWLSVKGVQGIYRKFSKTFTPKSEREKALKEVNQELRGPREALQQIQDRFGGGKIPDTTAEIEEAIGEARSILTTRNSSQEALLQIDILKGQNNALVDYAEIEGVTPKIESVFNNVTEALQSTTEALDQFFDAKTPKDFSEAADRLTDITTANTQTIEAIDTVLTEIQENIPPDGLFSKITFDNFINLISGLKQVWDSTREKTREIEEGEGGDDIEEIDVDMEIPLEYSSTAFSRKGCFKKRRRYKTDL